MINALLYVLYVLYGLIGLIVFSMNYAGALRPTIDDPDLNSNAMPGRGPVIPAVLLGVFWLPLSILNILAFAWAVLVRGEE